MLLVTSQESCLLSRDEVNKCIEKVFRALSIDQNLKQNLKNTYDSIISEIESLKEGMEKLAKENQNQNKTVDSLVKKINDIEMKLSLQQINVNSCEIVAMFRIYFINPIIKRHYFSKRTRFQTWGDLTSNQSLHLYISSFF